jgi:hypothetical protein
LQPSSLLNRLAEADSTFASLAEGTRKVA